MYVMDEGYDTELNEAVKRGKYMKKDYIKAVMIGHAVGDALGVPVEFCLRKNIEKNPVTDMRGYGTYDVPAGSWSDDTSMSIAALDSLSSGEIDYFDIMVNFAKWLNDGEYTPTGKSFDVGRTCLRSILNFVGVSYSEDYGFILPPGFDIFDCGLRDERSNGNGSLMRIHPFVLYAYMKYLNGTEEGYWRWMNCIKQASSLTHAHDRAVMGCHIYADCLSFLLKEPSKESLKAAIKFAEGDLDYLPEFEHYRRIFEPDFDKLPIDEIKSTGYVVDTLEAALWCLLTTDSYRDCVLKAVNLGGDTDTIAAVAGGLAGALYGYDAIPLEWRETLIKRDYIEEMCERAEMNWSK